MEEGAAKFADPHKALLKLIGAEAGVADGGEVNGEGAWAEGGRLKVEGIKGVARWSEKPSPPPSPGVPGEGEIRMAATWGRMKAG